MDAQQVYTGALSAGALFVGLYACVLYQRKLQLRRHQMYINGLVQTLETLMKIRKLR